MSFIFIILNVQTTDFVQTPHLISHQKEGHVAVKDTCSNSQIIPPILVWVLQMNVKEFDFFLI